MHISNRTLLKRIILLGVGGVLFWQWLSFSLSYGLHSHKGVDAHAAQFDYLFHKDETKLKKEIAEILKSSKDEVPPHQHKNNLGGDRSHQLAALNFDLSDLESIFGEDWHWRWIQMRVSQNWREMCAAVRALEARYPQNFHNRMALNILILPGVLSLTDFAHPDRAFHGGPLGELTQWADVIATLYLLGHKLSLRWDIRYAGIDLGLLAANSDDGGCGSDAVDLVYTDLGGHSELPNTVKQKYRYKFRLLDVYGTEVMYNVADYARSRGLDRGAGMRDLHTKQFFTMYPEVPDNSFVGFIISSSLQNSPAKEDIGILYGKEAAYLRGAGDLIALFRKFMEIHVTLPRSPEVNVHPGIVNHGIVHTEEYREIVAKAKYFIGLGNPVEGPGMLEAVARGCIVIQPSFSPGRKLAGKPNNRTISSQVPYLERIGQPNVFTVDYSNITQLELVLNSTQHIQVKPKLPAEFTARGYIQRMNAYIENQRYCPHKTKWPPDAELVPVKAAHESQSCADRCDRQGLVCEPNLFPSLNSAEPFHKIKLSCDQIEYISSIHAPAFNINSNTCLLQNDTRLFSCASYNIELGEKVFRVCPCRTFMKEQRALCDSCS